MTRIGGYPCSMTDSNDLATWARKARERAARLARAVAETAGRVAETEERIAEQAVRIAGDRPDSAPRLHDRARRARSFAEHERAEQRRWARYADHGGPDRRPGGQD
jgi:hypothetical protein